MDQTVNPPALGQAQSQPGWANSRRPFFFRPRVVGIAAVVLASGWGLARDSVNLALDAVPKSIELAQVQQYFRSLDGVVQDPDGNSLFIHKRKPGHP